PAQCEHQEAVGLHWRIFFHRTPSVNEKRPRHRGPRGPNGRAPGRLPLATVLELAALRLAEPRLLPLLAQLPENRGIQRGVGRLAGPRRVALQRRLHGGELLLACAALAALLRGHVCLPDRGVSEIRIATPRCWSGRTVTSGSGRTSRQLWAGCIFLAEYFAGG